MAAKTFLLAALAAVGGLFLAPVLWAALTGLIAGLLTAFGLGVPAVLSLAAGVQAAPVIAVIGAAGAVWLVVS